MTKEEVKTGVTLFLFLICMFSIFMLLAYNDGSNSMKTIKHDSETKAANTVSDTVIINSGHVVTIEKK